MSDATIPGPRAAITLYAAAAAAVLFAACVAWLALHPNVPDTYRAYYIDHTTTCMDQPVSGDYAFGTTVSFRADGGPAHRTLRVCGWEGPAGDGLHAVGDSSRLRFDVPAGQGPLRLALELVAVDASPAATQRVDVLIGGRKAATLDVPKGTPRLFAVNVPAATANGTPLEVELAYPNAVLMNPRDADTRKRSIKLTAARLDAVENW